MPATWHWVRTLLSLLAVVLGVLPTTVGAQPKEYPYRIATTCGMVTDIVRQVAGPHAQVEGLMGEGVDPHLYKPTRGDIASIIKADVVFYSGLKLEGRMGDTFDKARRNGKPVEAVTQNLDHQFLLAPPEFSGHHDPHVWMDVSAWSKCVSTVADTLAKFDPPHTADYQRHAAAYQQQLSDLHAYVKQVIASIPQEQRVLVTAHDAFNYFGRAYAIDVRGIQGISTESEAGLDDINRMVDFLVSRKIRAVFVETSVSDKNVKALLEGAKQRGHDLRIGGKLFSDAMGAAGTYEGTYIGMLDHNATVIARALGGQAPERGLHGKLSSAD